MRSYSAALLALATSALAYQITSPNAAQGWTSTGSNTVTWQRVSTDASNFSLVLTNTDRSVMANNNQILVALVDGTTGSYSVPQPSSGYSVGGSYRLNFVQSTTELNTIYAQSDEFNITQGTSSSSVSSTASVSSASASSTGSTMTVSGTSGSASSTGGASGLNPTASDTSTSPTTSSGALPLAGVQTGLLGLIALVGALVA